MHERKGDSMKKEYKEVSIELVMVDADIVVASPTTSGPKWK